MSKDRPATASEIATLKAIESVVATHHAATTHILNTNEPTKMLKLALEDATAAKALFALDPKGLSDALALIEDDRSDHIDTVNFLHDMGEKDFSKRSTKRRHLEETLQDNWCEARTDG